MTAVLESPTDTSSAAVHANPDAPLTVVIDLDPAQVAQHPDNIRDATRGIKELTASVAEVGVLVPLIVVPVAQVPGHQFEPEVTHVAIDGNRRQAAAAAAGLPLPCIVRADMSSATGALRTMAVTALMRDGLTAAEESHAVAALFEQKMSGAAISRALGRSAAAVKTARRAAAVRAEITEQAADYPLTLDQLAILADWQDNPEAIAALLHAAPRGQMDHVVAQLRAEAIADAAINAALAPLVMECLAAAVPVLESEPNTREPGGPRLLSALAPGDDPAGPRYTPQSHTGCPGHAVWIGVEYYEADPDQDTPEQVEVSHTYVCTDPASNGHISHHWGDRNEPHSYRTGRTPTPGGQSDAEREAAARAAADTKRAERSALVRLNKEALAAQSVRRAFLRQSFTVKSRQKKMSTWALARLVNRDRTFLNWTDGLYSPLLAEVLGGTPAEIIAAAEPARHPLLLWAQIVTAYEHDFPKDSHRNNSPARAEYLRHLKDIGYTLADVDQTVIDTARPQPSRTTTPGDAAPADEVAGETDAAEKAGDDLQNQEVTTD